MEWCEAGGWDVRVIGWYRGGGVRVTGWYRGRMGCSPGGDDLVLRLPGCVCPKVKDMGPFWASRE